MNVTPWPVPSAPLQMPVGLLFTETREVNPDAISTSARSNDLLTKHFLRFWFVFFSFRVEIYFW